MDDLNSQPHSSAKAENSDDRVVSGTSEIQSHAPLPEEQMEHSTAATGDLLDLRAGGTLICFSATLGERPSIVYCGPDLPGVPVEQLVELATRQHAPGGSSVHVKGSIINEMGTGMSGPAGLIAQRRGQDWAIDLRVKNVSQINDHTLVITCRDDNTAVEVDHNFALDAQSGVLRSNVEIRNLGNEELQVDWCSALCLPLDPRLSRIHSFTGRWSGEFQIEEVESFRGSFVRENKAGRTSHDAFPGIFVSTQDTDEHYGLAAAFHLAWSGNSRVRIDRQSDGTAVAQLGEMPFPGEIMLSAGSGYTTPDCIASWSQSGLSDASDRLHRYLNGQVLDARVFSKPRPVHYNTWEAVYFDHDEATLKALAKKASEIGAERFVLDDGWFGGRRNDSAGLGDWWVSPEVYPHGLASLVNAVHELGMEFGLWFEPEMVNPDSDLYRQHPDWILRAEGVETVPFRGQFTLDLTKQEVFDYLFERISVLVDEYSIAYIKWDMNRDTNHPGSAGRGAMHRQTHAVYSLINALREKHPSLEIESCASGGGRADFGILRHTDRFWTSDNNDARQRQLIQRGASYFFPLRVMGSHVGPRKCHITGRHFSMEYRAGTAIFGHMGMELDLRDESAEDLKTLAAGIDLYKKHRELLHNGKLIRCASAPYSNLVGAVARDEIEALFSYAQLDAHPETLPERLFFSGLSNDRQYRVRLVWPQRNPSVSLPSIVELADLLGNGSVFSGAALMEFGMQVPLIHPDTCLIYHLTAE